MNLRRAILPLLLGLAWAPAARAFDFFQPLDPPRPFQVMVHRGEADQAPENTAPAITRCAEDGFEWAEVDVRLSKDGQHFLFHDSNLDGKTNGKGPANALALEDLLKLDAGSWFAKRFAGKRLITLDEALALAKGKVNLYLDCKEINPELLAEQILKAGMEKQVVVFDDPETLARVRAASEGKIAIMPKWFPEDGMGEWIEKIHPDVIEVNADRVTPEICKAFHEKGIKVQTKNLGEWDNPRFWDKCIHAGVDYLQTDLPEEIVARAILAKLGERPTRFSCHRGGNRYAPENTMPAFEKAVRLGADFIEFDSRTSSDGKVFLLHDSKLDRTTNGKGNLKELPAEELAKLDAGSWFGKPFAGLPLPPLDDFLGAFAGKVGFYFDAKDIAPEALASSLERHGIVGETVVYQGPNFLARLRAINPEIRGMPGLDRVDQIEAAIEQCHPYAFDCRWELLSKELIDKCHGLGVKVFSDALGPHEKIDDYLKAIEEGIDLIQTDHPIRVLRAMELYNAKNKPENETEKKSDEDDSTDDDDAH